MLYLIITIVLICFASISPSQWIEGVAPILADYGSCVGFYNQSIYLLGGINNKQQLTEYLIPDNTFIDHGVSYLSPFNIYHYSQYWTQVDNILYVFHYAEQTISIFDMEAKLFTSSYISNIPTTGIQNVCIASSSTHLFLLGGDIIDISATLTSISNVEIYNLSNNKWQSDTPAMQTTRAILSCIFHAGTNKLYAIGGVQRQSAIMWEDSIERIESNDIIQNVNAWTYIEPLSQKLSDTRCVAYKNMIYIIGGYNSNYDGATDKVHVINVLSDTVTLFADSISMSLSDVAPIIVNHILYVFGGWINADNTGVNTWMTYDLYQSTAAPSSEPTTHISTAYPTTSFAPTEQPTNSTSAPTTDPITSDPTQTVYISTTSLDPTMNPNQQTTETSNPSLTTTESTSYPTSQSTEMISYSTVTTFITSMSTDADIDDTISDTVSDEHATEPVTDSNVKSGMLLLVGLILLGMFLLSCALAVCILVCWRRLKTMKGDIMHISKDEIPDISRKQTDQTFVECVNSVSENDDNKAVSLEGIKKEGERNEVVNNDANTGITRTLGHDVNDEEEYQNNSNIAEGEFIIQEDENHETQY